MSVNKHKPHVYVIPEDDHDRQIANGFAQHPGIKAPRQLEVVEPAGGWGRVLDTFKEEYVPLLQNQNTHVVLLIDFDGSPDERRKRVESEIPEALRSRVFVIGPRDTPEALRKSLGKSYEEIGKALADDCDGDKLDVWGHDQLLHNDSDRLRLRLSGVRKESLWPTPTG